MILASSFLEDLLRSVLQGTPSGAVFALIAIGFVLTYKTSGVFNLAFGAQAYISAAMFFKARTQWNWSIPLSLLVSVFVLAPAIGLVLERFLFRRLRTASAVAKLVVTIGLSVALPAVFEIFADYAPVAGRAPTGIVPKGSSVFYDPLGVYPFSRDELAAMGVILIAVVVLGAIFRFTSIGLSMRAVVESPRMTELNGIAADRVSAVAWALSSTFAGMAGVLIAPIRFNTLISNDFFNVVVVAIAAAAIGRLVSIPRALAGGIGLGWFIAVFNTFLPRWVDDYTWLRPLRDNFSNSLPFVVLFAILVLSMRAVVESPRMTELNGIAADRVSAVAWALSSTFAGMAGVLIAPIRFNTLISNDFFNVVVVAIAAAAIGRLVSIPRALAGGIGLGWFIAVFNTFLPRWVDDYTWLRPLRDNFSNSLPFVVLFAILVFWPAIRRSLDAGDPLAGVDPPPPAPAAAERHPKLTRFTRLFALGFFLFVGLTIFFRADRSWVFIVTTAVILSTIYLSITVITGFAGQISLCQGAFAAIGGFTVFQTADRYDLSVLVAALIGAAIAALVGAILSLPVLRLGGIWLAIATLAFALFFDAVLVRTSWIGGGDTALLQGTRVPRPILGPIDFGNDKSFLALAVIVFVITSVAVIQLREGTIGRTLRAIRGSEVAAESIGISPAKARIVAFATSAFIAGLGGSMLTMLQENVNYQNNFSPVGALFWLVLVVALGVRTVEGAAQAGAAYSMFEPLVLRGELFAWILRAEDRLPGLFPISGKWRLILFGFAAMQFARHPEGLVEHGKRRFTSRLNQRLRSGDLTEGADSDGRDSGVGAA